MRHRVDRRWCLHGDPPGLGLPVEQPPLHIDHGNRTGVVVGFVPLLLGPVVPGLAALGCETDQGVGVEMFQGLSGHKSSPYMRKARPQSGSGYTRSWLEVSATYRGPPGREPSPGSWIA